MSETMIDEIPSSLNGLITEIDHTMKETGVQNEDEETWLYRNNKSKNDELIDNTAAPSIDEITTQEIDMREKPPISLVGSQFDDDDDDDDDDIQVTIGNYEPEASPFQTNRQKTRTVLTTNPMMPPKPSITRGPDFDAQGMINGQPTYEHDILNAYKDEEKPWKKPGADITDYFNYGFTEETWAQYCERQRRLRSENNLARLNVAHIPPMPPMMQGHPQMVHQMNPHQMMMMNKPLNMPIMPRPMNMRKPDGKIGVIGSTDQTSRRPMFEAPNNFEHPPFMNGPSFAGSQSSNGQTVGDLISTQPTTNGHPPNHGTPPSGTHHIPTLGIHRMQMMSLPPGMQFRPQFGHPHAPGGPQFFPRGPVGGMHGDRPPQPYFVPHHPQQPWDNAGGPPVHGGFPPGSFPPQATAPTSSNNARAPSSRSPTPENHSSRSSTPEENRANPIASNENEKAPKDDRYKDRYRDERDHHSSSRRRLSPKDHASSSSSSYRSHHRSSEHEYERPRNERKSSRDRDNKYERYSRKRHHKEDTTRHHRNDDDLSRNHRSSHRTPTKTDPNELSQTLNEQQQQPEVVVSEFDPPISSSSPMNRSHHDDSERSSSRHSHHKKSSKRSRHDSDDERSGTHHHRRSKDPSSSNNKKSTDSLSDVKEQINE